MKLKITLALFFIFVSIAVHGYLTSHYYPLHFGMTTEKAMCNVGESFNCDAVAASSYSNLWGIPLSVWGLATNTILLGMFLVFWLGLTDNKSDWKRWSLYVAGASAAASIIMGVISFTQLTTYCLFCIILYFLSFGIFACLAMVQDEKVMNKLGDDLQALFTRAKGLTICILLIPIVSFLTHASIVKNYGAGELNKVIGAAVYDWQSTPKIDFTAVPAFTMGAPEAEAKLVIAEFADFRCGHCKDAAPSIHAFLKSHLKEVHFKFYTFPLDGECNTEMGQGDGVSCRLSKAVICADSQAKAPALHDLIFENQTAMQRLENAAKVDEELKAFSSKLAISYEQLVACMNESGTHDKITSHVQQAKAAGIRGTPTIFANSRRLDRGQMIPVLEAALKNADKVGK